MMASKPILESAVEARLRKKAASVGGKCVKFIPDLQRGFPDRILLLPDGVLVWVETKTVGGEIDGAQRIAHLLLRRLGQRVEVIWTKEQADRLIEDLIGKP